MHIGTAESERADTGQTGMSFRPRPGRGFHRNGGRNSGYVDGRVEFREMKRGRNGFRCERNKRAAYAGETGAGLKVADTGLDRGNDQGASCRVASRVHVVDSSELDGIAESRARAVRLYGVNVRRRKSGRVEGALQEGCLGVTARRRKTARSAVLVDGGSPHDSQDPVSVPFRVSELF